MSDEVKADLALMLVRHTNAPTQMVNEAERLIAENASLRSRATSAEATCARLREALRTISKQRLGDEIGDEEDRDNADYEFAYEMMVNLARNTLAQADGERG